MQRSSGPGVCHDPPAAPVFHLDHRWEDLREIGQHGDGYRQGSREATAPKPSISAHTSTQTYSFLRSLAVTGTTDIMMLMIITLRARHLLETNVLGDTLIEKRWTKCESREA